MNMIINKNCELRLFADDAIICITRYSNLAINDQLNEQIKSVEEWLQINKLH